MNVTRDQSITSCSAIPLMSNSMEDYKHC